MMTYPTKSIRKSVEIYQVIITLHRWLFMMPTSSMVIFDRFQMGLWVISTTKLRHFCNEECCLLLHSDSRFFFYLFRGLYEESIRYYVRALAMNPKADIAWQYLRFSLSYASRNDMFDACDSRNLDILQKEFPV